MFILVVVVPHVYGLYVPARFRRRVLGKGLSDFVRLFRPVAVAEFRAGEKKPNQVIRIRLPDNAPPDKEYLLVVLAYYDDTAKIVYSKWKRPMRPNPHSVSWYVQFKNVWPSTLRSVYGINPEEVKFYRVIVYEPRRPMSEEEKREWSTFVEGKRY